MDGAQRLVWNFGLNDYLKVEDTIMKLWLLMALMDCLLLGSYLVLVIKTGAKRIFLSYHK